MTVKAGCACGLLSVELPGETTAVVACHCIECQKRTGSPFGVGAYYPTAALQVIGESHKYVRKTSTGGDFISYFCPHCGSTVYWTADKHPTLTGVAVGNIADPSFPAPVRSVWERSKHEWVEIKCAVEHFAQSTIK